MTSIVDDLPIETHESCDRRDLADLPGRHDLQRRLERELRGVVADHAQSFGLLLVDIDRFRIINEGFGRRRGDAVLSLVADQLHRSGSTGSFGEVFWLGGDAFAVVTTRGEQLESWSHRVHVQLAEIVIREGFGLPLRSSGGGVVVGGGGALTPDDVLQRAELALNQAKAHGGSRIEFFDESRHRTVLLQQELRVEVLRGLARNEFEMYYQPIVRLADGAIAGFEALLRWTHPERGSLSPGLFIPVMERDGLIGLVGDWVMQRACQQFADLIEESRPWQPLMTVNVSRRQLVDDGFADHAVRHMEAAGLDPSCVGIEITETSAIDDFDTVRRQVEGLRQRGLRILIDDFGVGSSSLSTLHHLPVDLLKIDREFVRGAAASPRQRAISRAITEVGHALGLSLVAEGIETKLELAAVVQLGCDYGQGYFLGRPAPFDASIALLRQSRSRRFSRGVT